jgi:RNase H-fold protein (predicted Holliday junction resolvase)
LRVVGLDVGLRVVGLEVPVVVGLRVVGLDVGLRVVGLAVCPRTEPHTEANAK